MLKLLVRWLTLKNSVQGLFRNYRFNKYILKNVLLQGEINFVCALPGCDIIWPYEEVCKMALLTPEEKEYFGQTMTLNAMKHHFDYKLVSTGML